MFSKTYLFRIIVLSIGVLLTAGCGRPPKSKVNTVVFPTPTYSPGPTLPPVSLVDGSGNNAQGGTTAQPPTTGPLVQPNPNLNNQTPWGYLNGNLSGQPGPNDLRAMAYTGQSYRFGFSLPAGMTAQYQVSLPSGVVQEPGVNCTSPLFGTISNGQAVNMCIRFTQPTTGSIQPIRIMVQGQASTLGTFSISQNIWVVVIPGQADQYQYVIANGATVAPVVNRLFVEKNFQNANSTRQTINSTFAVQMLKNGQPAAIYNAQYTLQPANAGRIVQAYGGQIQIEAFVGGKITLVGTGVDQAGQQLQVRGELSIPRQISLKYTERNKVCIDSHDKAVLVCSNTSGNTYSLSVTGANGFGSPVAVAPGAFQQTVASLPAQKDSNGRWYANYTITVDGNQPNGAIVCEAVVHSYNGTDEQRFVVPGL